MACGPAFCFMNTSGFRGKITSMYVFINNLFYKYAKNSGLNFLSFIIVFMAAQCVLFFVCSGCIHFVLEHPLGDLGGPPADRLLSCGMPINHSRKAT